MKILIIEDEGELLQSLTAYMASEGHSCNGVGTFREARQLLLRGQFDAVILDLNLPDGDGMQLIREIQRNQDAIILITSARSGLEEKLTGLNLGADDYLVKPFHLAEMSSRLKAIFRRKHYNGVNQLTFGDLMIDLDSREVFVDHSKMKLTKTEFNILTFLVRNKNKVVTKSTLVEHVWGDHMEDAYSLDFVYSHIKNLRKKLTERGVGEFVKSVYGLGYKFSTEE